MIINKVAIDDNILIKDKISTAGSKILYNFVPPFNSAVFDKLKEAGAQDIKQTKPNEFGISLTDGFGVVESVSKGGAEVGIGCDINGSIRKEASKNGIYFIKPTYGTVSRFGLVSTSPAFEQIGVACKDVETGFETLAAIAGYDGRDGAIANVEKYSYSVREEDLKGLKIGVLSSGEKNIDRIVDTIKALGAEVETVDFPLIDYVPAVAYIISAAETSNSISRFDGIKFGYRPEEYSSFDDIYIKSRTECFTFETKLVTLIGLLMLTKEKYGYFDKALKVRRLIKEAADLFFERYDAMITPVTPSNDNYDDFFSSYDNLKYISLPNLTGSPALAIPGGFQFIAKTAGENTLLRIGKCLCGKGEVL